jgi:type 1 glutamine amidotransferase
VLADALRDTGLTVDVEVTLRSLDDTRRLRRAALVVPIWTMGRLSWERQESLRDAVAAGTGLGGVHGSGDAFRSATEYQYVLGGQFVAHPGGDGVEYAVEIADRAHPVTRGLRGFRVRSERYYLHVDPSVHVLASTPVATGDGRPFPMPVAWTRTFERGRVFYCALGHTPELVAQPEVLELTVRGLLWAAGRDD